MISVATDADLSFLPFRTGGRDLDLSRFDTGGVESAKSAQQLSSYLFSDRGIYRPGETTHLGVITRTADWKTVPRRAAARGRDHRSARAWSSAALN